MGFHTMLTLGYLVPGVYLFARIWQLFIPKKYRNIYLIAFTTIFLIYPVSNLMGENSPGIFSKLMVATANYLLPFFLYLFLLVLLSDLILLINKFFRIIQRERLADPEFRMKIFIVMVSLSVIVVIAGIINFNTISITDYKVNVQKKGSDLSHLRIAFVSDFHLQDNTPVKFVAKAVQKINEVKPDLMIFGGDIVEGDREDENMKVFENLLSGITSKYGVYGVLGNHEHYGFQDKGGFFDRAGIKIITDSAVIFGRSLILAGRNDRHIITRKSIDQLMMSIPDSLPVVLIDHRPDEIEQISKTKTDILLSGHTHNGQLFPINFITKSLYDLSMGYKIFGNTHVFVSSGIRLWGPPVRTTGKSEIVVVDVSFTK